MIERDDWTDDGPPDTPASVPAKSQSISRPDWTDGPSEVPEPVPVKEQAIVRPDWNEAETAPGEEFTDQETDDAYYDTVNELLDKSQQKTNGETMIAELAEDHDLSIAHEAIEDVLDAVPAWDRADFEAGFDDLPSGAKTAIVAELAQPGEYEGLSGEDALEKFATTPEGAELVALWNEDAEENLARVQARLARIESNTSPGAIETLWDWFDGLPSAQAKAVLQVLAE